MTTNQPMTAAPPSPPHEAHLSGHVHGEEAAQSVAPGCCHTPGGHGIDRVHCHRCFVETPDRSTPRGEEAVEIVRGVLDSIVPNTDGVIWNYQHDDGQSEPVTIDHAVERVLAALTSAGLLATEQEWGVHAGDADLPNGSIDMYGNEPTARKFQTATGGTVVSRGVTPWREQA